MNPIVCLAGPTASGKTALAVELAQALETQPEVPVTYGMHIGRKAR